MGKHWGKLSLKFAFLIIHSKQFKKKDRWELKNKNKKNKIKMTLY